MQLTSKQISKMKINNNEINLIEAGILLKFASFLNAAKIVGEEQKIEGKRGRVSKIWEVSDSFLADMKMVSVNKPAEIVEKKQQVVETVKEKLVSKPAKKPTKKSAIKDIGVVA